MPQGKAIVRSTGDVMQLQIEPRDKKHFPKFLKENLGAQVDLTIYLRGVLANTVEGGIIEFADLTETQVRLEKPIDHRTRPQIDTLRGIERFLYWAQAGHKPVAGDHDIYWIHEGLIATYSSEAINLSTQRMEPMRTSDPRMTTKIMARIIDGALNELCTTDIPDDVLKEIGDDMLKLWASWYDWRYNKAEQDPLHEVEAAILTWEQYLHFHPVCELCGMPDRDSDQLERMHIVSGGAAISVYEKPWNWLHAHHSHHHQQHAARSGGEVGWIAILKDFPHVKGKIERARSYAHAKGIL